MNIETQFEAFREMMEQGIKTEKGDADEICVGCQYYRPDFKYRFCQYTECRWIKGFKTFRERYYE